MDKKRILFVINPISGGRRKAKFADLAGIHLDKAIFEPEFVYTHKPDQASALAQKGVQDGFDIIVAVGGDGTINEVARALLHGQVALGIIPLGSGNGFARSLNIPLRMNEAIQRLNHMQTQYVDCGLVNNLPFFNVSGIGFDAKISRRFAVSGKRGMLGYVRIVLTEIMQYKSKEYHVCIDGIELHKKAFAISIANSAQYGNGAYIAPEASVNDGLLDVCIIKPFPVFLFPKMIYHLFSKTANRTRYVDIRRCKDLHILAKGKEDIHLDGDLYTLDGPLKIKVLPKALKVIC